MLRGGTHLHEGPIALNMAIKGFKYGFSPCLLTRSFPPRALHAETQGENLWKSLEVRPRCVLTYFLATLGSLCPCHAKPAHGHGQELQGEKW